MRINKYVALHTALSRRAADAAIAEGRVLVDGTPPPAGMQITEEMNVTLDGKTLTSPGDVRTILLNKPVGYVCSRNGQGNKTVYELLPEPLHHLKPVGRLDKDSSGLLLMTNDGQLAFELTHPKFQKTKKYKIALDKNLAPDDYERIAGKGVLLDDGLSKLELEMINNQAKEYKVTMSEGRNRQIRRTFDSLGYKVVKLHRTHFGPYRLDKLATGKFDFKEI